MKWKIEDEIPLPICRVFDEKGKVIMENAHYQTAIDLVKAHNVTQGKILIMTAMVENEDHEKIIYRGVGVFDNPQQIGHFDKPQYHEYFLRRCKHDIENNNCKMLGNPDILELIGYLPHKHKGLNLHEMANN